MQAAVLDMDLGRPDHTQILCRAPGVDDGRCGLCVMCVGDGRRGLCDMCVDGGRRGSCERRVEDSRCKSCERCVSSLKQDPHISDSSKTRPVQIS